MGLIRARDRRAPSLLPSAPPKAPVSLVPISVRSRRIGHRLFKRRLRTSCVCATPSQWKRSVPRRHAAPPPQASSPQASPGRRAWMSDQRHRWFPVEPHLSPTSRPECPQCTAACLQVRVQRHWVAVGKIILVFSFALWGKCSLSMCICACTCRVVVAQWSEPRSA